MRKLLLATCGAIVAATFAGQASAAVCIGNCGSATPNGDVTAPPAFGPGYSYISTSGGVSGAGQISGVGGTNGSQFTTDAFTANAGDALNFYFNHITSDGTLQFTDYSWAALLNASDASLVAYLFTARTTPTGDTSPGFGLPTNAATLNPITTPIIPGQTNWAQLGGSSGACWQGVGNGCGQTGWINSNYVVGSSGSYLLRLGTTNFGDTSFNTGLAFAGVTIGGTQIPTPGGNAVPEPSTWAMMLLGFFGIGGLLRRKVVNASVSYA